MLDPDTRRRHLYVVGQTNTGKSTLPLNLIAQDLAAGQGLAVLDPHGEVVVLLQVPRNRSNVIMDLRRKSGEFPASDEELDDAATTVYEGI